MYSLRVLGGFTLQQRSGAALSALPLTRAEATLAVLAVCGDLGCTRERLMALLWPESDEAHSRHRLRDVLNALRHALGADAVLATGEHLRLNPSAVTSDVHEFSQSLGAGRHGDAVAVYGGSLLEGFHVDDAPEFERWLDRERTRLGREYAEALTHLATAAERARAWGEAAGWWARAAEHDPLNSHLVLRQAEALAAMGDRANALKVADAHTRRLREELDLAPDRDVLANIDRIRRGELPMPPGGAPDLTPGPPADRHQMAAAFAAALTNPEARVPPPPVPPLRRRRRRAVRLVAAAVVLVIVALAVERWLRPSASASRYPRTAIAVLPLENLSAEGPQAYFAPGLHDELLTQLSKVAALSVRPRASVMGYAGTTKPIKQIADELAVGAIVEGSVQVVGNRLRVNVHLIDPLNKKGLWAEHYDRTLDDALAVQREIARAIVEAVGATLTGEEASAIAAAPTVNAGAYRLYLKGREYYTREGYYRANIDSAQQLYELALTLDPSFALAHAALSEVHGTNYHVRWDHSPSRAARQREEAEVALRLAPDLPQAHLAMASWYYQAKRDYPHALSELRIAVDGLPGDAETWARIGRVTRRMGNWSEAVTAHEKSTQLNPRSAWLIRELGVTYLWMRRYAEAVTAFDRASSLDPSTKFPWLLKGLTYAHWQGQLDTLRAALRSWKWSPTGEFSTNTALDLIYWDRRADSMVQVSRTAPAGVFDSQDHFLPASLYAAWAHQLRGDHPAARAAFDSARAFLDSTLALHPDDERMHAARGLALAGLSRREEALREARWLQQSVPYREDKYQGVLLVEARAQILAQVGDADAALDEIRRLLTEPSLTTVHTLRLDPRWDPIRHDPRFQALLAKYAGPNAR